MSKVKTALIKLYRFSNSWTGTIVIVLLAIFFFAQAFAIPSGSMRSTLLEGDHLIVKKFIYGVPTPHIPWLEVAVLPDFDGDGHLIKGDGPKRGDVVVFRYPENPKLHYVKRCVALGGDMVMIRKDALYIRPSEGDAYIRANYADDQIAVFGNELWVKDPYRQEHKGVQYDQALRERGIALRSEMNAYGPITVPKGRYFMMGDNRDHSADSRFWGSVPYDLIVGSPWFSYFSWEPRSYDDMISKSMFQNDFEALKAVCGDAEFKSDECRRKWDKERYKVRWDRIGKTLKGLEDLL
ncbi:MAG: signal peptidase I [Helicobacteraceae bacterium]|jgi:signal peptidase I|nr:signal peptidase I [Helicobacteraceae bacterium]